MSHHNLKTENARFNSIRNLEVMNSTLMRHQSSANMAAMFNQQYEDEEEEDFDIEYLLHQESNIAQGKILAGDGNISNETNNVSKKDTFVDRQQSLYV